MHIARSVLLLTLLAAAAQGAEVYRSKNADGSITYSDRPTNQSSEPVPGLSTSHGNPGQAAPAQAAGASGNAAPQAPAKPAPLSAGPTSTELRAERQKNCDTAKERQQRYDLSRRLFRTNDKGEREYLDDNAVAEARAKAAQDVKDWCD